MEKLVLNNIEVVDCTVWENMRNVNVHTVNIAIDGGILNYMISPTSAHDFMMKSGFSRYPYKTWIKKIQVNKDNTIELFGYGLEKLQLKLKMTDEQINHWKEYTKSHMEWITE